MHKSLVIDDEVSYRELLKNVFTERGCSVRTASGGKDAMAVASEFIPDVLIVDWMLGDEQDGADIVSSCRKINPNVAVVFISGYPNFGLQAAADADASIVWLPKPFHLDQIVKAVKAICDPASVPSTSPQLR